MSALSYARTSLSLCLMLKQIEYMILSLSSLSVIWDYAYTGARYLEP